MAFAIVEDVETRLGLSLTGDERIRVELLLDSATAVIAEVVGKDEADIDPVPPVVEFVAVEVAARMLNTSPGVQSEQESLGAFSYSRTYKRDGGGVLLTKSEELLVRKAVYGGTSGSVRIRSHVDDIYEALTGS